jgi:hypothetical protein
MRHGTIFLKPDCIHWSALKNVLSSHRCCRFPTSCENSRLPCVTDQIEEIASIKTVHSWVMILSTESTDERSWQAWQDTIPSEKIIRIFTALDRHNSEERIPKWRLQLKKILPWWVLIVHVCFQKCAVTKCLLCYRQIALLVSVCRLDFGSRCTHHTNVTATTYLDTAPSLRLAKILFHVRLDCEITSLLTYLPKTRWS